MCSNEALREKIGKSTFEPYIRSITFPFYKNLRRGTNLTFIGRGRDREGHRSAEEVTA